MASVITNTTPKEPHGFLRPKLLVGGMILLALLAVLSASLLREATIAGPTAATAPRVSEDSVRLYASASIRIGVSCARL